MKIESKEMKYLTNVPTCFWSETHTNRYSRAQEPKSALPTSGFSVSVLALSSRVVLLSSYDPAKQVPAQLATKQGRSRARKMPFAKAFIQKNAEPPSHPYLPKTEPS